MDQSWFGFDYAWENTNLWLRFRPKTKRSLSILASKLAKIDGSEDFTVNHNWEVEADYPLHGNRNDIEIFQTLF